MSEYRKTGIGFERIDGTQRFVRVEGGRWMVQVRPTPAEFWTRVEILDELPAGVAPKERQARAPHCGIYTYRLAGQDYTIEKGLSNENDDSGLEQEFLGWTAFVGDDQIGIYETKAEAKAAAEDQIRGNHR